jgi:hypothetical protein
MRRKLYLAGVSLAAMTCAALVSAQTSTETYTYDPLGRLVKVVTVGGANNGQTQSICYDKADNRTQYVANTSAGATECGGAPAPTPTPTPTPSPTPSPTPTPTPPPSNSPPITSPDELSANGCTGTFFVNLTANDTDPEGNYPLALTNITRSSGSATAAIIFGSTVQVTLSGVELDVSNFVYTVRDSLGATATGTLTVSASMCSGFGGGPSPP